MLQGTRTQESSNQTVHDERRLLQSLLFLHVVADFSTPVERKEARQTADLSAIGETEQAMLPLTHCNPAGRQMMRLLNANGARDISTWQ